MTLFRQLVLAIGVFITAILVVSLLLSVHNSRLSLYEQLQTHAEDTATALGLSISHAAQEKDLAQVRSMIDVVFDRGYFRQIMYRNLEGKPLVRRDREILIEGIPQWFIDWVQLPQSVGQAEVVSGWFRLGEVAVIGHPGYAYRDLWRIFKQQLRLFAIIALVACLCAGFALRLLLRPLKKVEQQADAICRREFPTQKELPKTVELRQVVVAMNRMASKLQSMFQEQLELTENLHKEAHRDPVTGLSNRRDFDARLEAFVKSERSGGAASLFLLQISGLQAFNDSEGRSAGDAVLKAVAQQLRAALEEYPDCLVARRSGVDFSVFLPSLPLEKLDQLAAAVFRQVSSLVEVSDHPILGLHMGIACDHSALEGHQLLQEADLALRHAQQGEPTWYRYGSSAQELHNRSLKDAGDWLSLLKEAIAARRLIFHFQPVYGSDGRTLLHAEALCRLQDGEQLLNAGRFMPMVAHYGLGELFDRAVVETLAAQVTRGNTRLCINLSAHAVCCPTFIEWLKDFLVAHPDWAPRVLFEVPGQMLSHAEPAVRQLSRVLVEAGSALSLDHFGVGGGAFSYLQSLPLSLLKLDRCFIDGIDKHTDNQFYVKSLVQIARTCDLTILAEGVETENQWQTLIDLGLDGGQGYYLARPSERLPENE